MATATIPQADQLADLYRGLPEPRRVFILTRWFDALQTRSDQVGEGNMQLDEWNRYASELGAFQAGAA